MDPMFDLLWQRYRTWADTARRLKSQNTTWKRRVLILTIAGTALATLGPHAGHPLVARALPTLGAALLAVATFFGKQLLDAKHEEKWTKARAAAEHQASHYEALALRYRETAQALKALKAEFTSPGTTLSAADLVSSAETIMQAENAVWLAEMASVKSA